MANHVHTHGDATPHEHADAAPGHTHDQAGNVVAAAGQHGFGTAPAAETTPQPATVAAGTAAAGHSHPGMGEHTHAEDAPGHTHDAERREEVRVGPTGGGMAARMLLTLLGAAGMILGAFLNWFRFGEQEVPPGVGLTGVDISNSVFYSTDDPFGASLVSSAGLVVIVLGVLALLGLVFRTGWLTTLAGVLGIVAFALVVITLYRVEEGGFGIGNVGLGLWITLAGAVLAVIGAFFGSRPRVVTRTY